jgi:thioredoxin-related protein
MARFQSAMKAILTTVLMVCAMTLPALAGGKAGWDDDYDKSLAKAKAEGKPALLDFTGSDWCGWCIKLDEEVFSKSDFKTFAKNSLVLVELDYPHGKKLPRKVEKQNAELKDKFGIKGYPTLILVDGSGKEIKRWGGYSKTFFEDLKAAMPATTASADKK